MRRRITVSPSLSHSVMIIQQKIIHICQRYHTWNTALLLSPVLTQLKQQYSRQSHFLHTSSILFVFSLFYFDGCCFSSTISLSCLSVFPFLCRLTYTLPLWLPLSLPSSFSSFLSLTMLKMMTMHNFYSSILFLYPFLFLPSSSFSDRQSFPVLLYQFSSQSLSMTHATIQNATWQQPFSHIYTHYNGWSDTHVHETNLNIHET